MIDREQIEFMKIELILLQKDGMTCDRGERLIKLSDSWFSAKDIKVCGITFIFFL